MTELVYKCYVCGDLIAAFKDEDDLELFRAQKQMHGSIISDCMEEIQ